MLFEATLHQDAGVSANNHSTCLKRGKRHGRGKGNEDRLTRRKVFSALEALIPAEAMLARSEGSQTKSQSSCEVANKQYVGDWAVSSGKGYWPAEPSYSMRK